MNIANVEITRAIAHEVVRAQHITERPPIYGDELITLDTRGKGLVGKRLVSTVASGSHCVDVTVEDATAGSPFRHATSMLDANESTFIESSKHLAQSLSSAQTAGSIKSGSAIFVQGTCMADAEPSRFLAIIKADSDQGFYKEINGERITLKFVSEMLLGESQRLIKIGLFIEQPEYDPCQGTGNGETRLPEEFSVKVFDHMMQNSGNGDAAVYFYSTFLRCRLANGASRQTKQFFEIARGLVDTMTLSQTEKVEMRGDVIAYLRGNRAILEPRTFAQDVLPVSYQDSFIRKCQESGITGAITKDLSLLKGKLRRQSVRFSSNVVLYAPPEAFRDSIKFGVSQDGWTELKIRGDVEASP